MPIILLVLLLVAKKKLRFSKEVLEYFVLNTHETDTNRKWTLRNSTPHIIVCDLLPSTKSCDNGSYTMCTVCRAFLTNFSERKFIQKSLH